MFSIFDQELNDNLNIILKNIDSGLYENNNMINGLFFPNLNDDSSFIFQNYNLEIPQSEVTQNKKIKDIIEANSIDFNLFQKLNEKNAPQPISGNSKKKFTDEGKTDKSTRNKTYQKTKEQLILGSKNKKTIKAKVSRVDYAIKNIKVQISKFLRDLGNKLIKECNFQNDLRNKKLFLPSYDYFTGNSNIKNNQIFLNFTSEQILTYPEEIINNGKKQKNNRLQRKNKDKIKQIKEYIEEQYPDEIPEQFQKLLNFFRMTYEDIIILFYNSELFKDYCYSKNAEQYNEQFIKTKGYSLLEKNGLIKLLKKF